MNWRKRIRSHFFFWIKRPCILKTIPIMALAGLLKASLLGSYAPKLEANGVTLYDLRSIPEENRKAIEDIGLSVGMGKADLKKFKKIHEKLHLQIHSFHFKKGKEVGTKGPFRIVLVGKVGSAKTSVFNALTGLTSETGAGCESVT